MGQVRTWIEDHLGAPVAALAWLRISMLVKGKWKSFNPRTPGGCMEQAFASDREYLSPSDKNSRLPLNWRFVVDFMSSAFQGEMFTFKICFLN